MAVEFRHSVVLLGATSGMVRATAEAFGAAGYALGLVLSTALDLPTGPAIVWALAALALCWYSLSRRWTS